MQGAPSWFDPSGFVSWPHIKHNETVVLQDAAEVGTQVAVKFLVVIEPPKRWPGKNDKVCS